MLFSINPNNGLPIYRQLVNQIKHAIAAGTLKSGDKVPSQRDLAAELIISHLTVKKAYEMLEDEGIIVTHRGRGTFVAKNVPDNLYSEGVKQLHYKAKELVDSAKLLGLKREDYLDIIENTWKEEKNN